MPPKRKVRSHFRVVWAPPRTHGDCGARRRRRQRLGARQKQTKPVRGKRTPVPATPAPLPGAGLDGSHPITCLLYTWALLLDGVEEEDQPPHDERLRLVATDEPGCTSVLVHHGGDMGASFARLKVGALAAAHAFPLLSLCPLGEPRLLLWSASPACCSGQRRLAH